METQPYDGLSIPSGLHLLGLRSYRFGEGDNVMVPAWFPETALVPFQISGIGEYLTGVPQTAHTVLKQY